MALRPTGIRIGSLTIVTGRWGIKLGNQAREIKRMFTRDMVSLNP